MHCAAWLVSPRDAYIASQKLLAKSAPILVVYCLRDLTESRSGQTKPVEKAVHGAGVAT